MEYRGIGKKIKKQKLGGKVKGTWKLDIEHLKGIFGDPKRELKAKTKLCIKKFLLTKGKPELQTERTY